jgi:adenylylsulfate kinase
MSEKMANIVWNRATVTRAQRERLNGHKSLILWFTGLSGAGKSTLAHAVEERLHEMGCRTFVFDGDNVRHGLCGDLGFSEADRAENIRRIGEMTKLFIETGVIALAAFISPFRAEREKLRAQVAAGDFVEVYCRCPLAVCEQRDKKGLYARARAGEVQEFTGISSPYEPPEHPELVIDSDRESLEQSVDRIIDYLRGRNIFAAPG